LTKQKSLKAKRGYLTGISLPKAAILMKRKRLLYAVGVISGIISDYSYKCNARRKPSYFSREGGKICFSNLIAITLNFLAKSIQTELNAFFESVLKSTERVSKQAFLEARFKLKVDAFRILFDKTAELGAEPSGLTTFRGYRILAIDGADLQLEDTDTLRTYFGVKGGGTGLATARTSAMVDVLNKGIILDAQIDKLSFGERVLAMRHFDRLDELQIEEPLLVFDRGYASTDMFDRLGDTAFLFRLQKSFNAEIDLLPLGDFVKDFTIKKQVYRLRVLKFLRQNGDVDILVTNLLEQMISSDELKELYRLRWGVETAFRTLKSTLQIENFSGTSQLIVEQDFFAAMFLKNMVAFAKIDSDEIVSQNENPDNLYRQQTNENQLVGILKDKLVLALLDNRPRARARKVEKIIQEAARHTIPIRPDRYFPRIRKHSKRFSVARKPAL